MSGQEITPQVEALKAAGCSELYYDEGTSDHLNDRPGLSRVLRALESGDTLKVGNVDQIALSFDTFAEFRKRLGERTIRIVLIDCEIQTTPLLAETAMKLAMERVESEQP